MCFCKKTIEILRGCHELNRIPPQYFTLKTQSFEFVNVNEKTIWEFMCAIFFGIFS